MRRRSGAPRSERCAVGPGRRWRSDDLAERTKRCVVGSQLAIGRRSMAKDDLSDDLAQQIDGLFLRLRQLHQQGRYQEAVIPATQARDLARQYLGEAQLLYAGAADPAGRPRARQHLGEAQLLYACTLDCLALLYTEMGDHVAAL